MVDAQLVKQSGLLIYGVNEFKAFILGMQDHARMRKESKDNRFAIRGCSQFFYARYDLTVPNMHPIKSTDGNHGIFNRLKFINMMVDLHLLSKGKRRKLKGESFLPAACKDIAISHYPEIRPLLIL